MQLDLTDKAAVDTLFKQHQNISAVVNCAALSNPAQCNDN